MEFFFNQGLGLAIEQLPTGLSRETVDNVPTSLPDAIRIAAIRQSGIAEFARRNSGNSSTC